MYALENTWGYSNLHDQWLSYFHLYHIPHCLHQVLLDWIRKSPNECNKSLKTRNNFNIKNDVILLSFILYHLCQDQLCNYMICFHLHQWNWETLGFGCKFDLRKRFLRTHLQRNSSILQICKRDLHSKQKVLKVLCFGAGSHILIESFSEKFM